MAEWIHLQVVLRVASRRLRRWSDRLSVLAGDDDAAVPPPDDGRRSARERWLEHVRQLAPDYAERVLLGETGAGLAAAPASPEPDEGRARRAMHASPAARADKGRARRVGAADAPSVAKVARDGRPAAERPVPEARPVVPDTPPLEPSLRPVGDPSRADRTGRITKRSEWDSDKRRTDEERVPPEAPSAHFWLESAPRPDEGDTRPSTTEPELPAPPAGRVPDTVANPREPIRETPPDDPRRAPLQVRRPAPPWRTPRRNGRAQQPPGLDVDAWLRPAGASARTPVAARSAWTPAPHVPAVPTPGSAAVMEDRWPDLPERPPPQEDVSQALRAFERTRLLRDEQSGTRWNE